MGIETLFSQELKVINIGLSTFMETLVRSGVDVRQVDPNQQVESKLE